MTFTKDNLRTIASGNEQHRVEKLREILGYPVIQRDPAGSKYWYLHPGADEDDAYETSPIAVGFFSELNNATDQQVKQLLIRQKQQEIYGHYTNRTDVNQPVMYILLPTEEGTGRIPLVLPTEGGLLPKHIQSFSWDTELITRLNRLKQGELPVADKALYSIPQVDWVFYPAAKTAGELAQSLAEAARTIEQAIPAIYNREAKNGYLHKLLASFQKELLPTLKLKSDSEKDYSFADIYAQTIAYALFTARVFSYVKDKREGTSTHFDRKTAWQELPETNPFLRRLFEDISKQSASELGDELIGAISEIFSVLRAAKMDAILSDFQLNMNREDIVIRFYEDFLAAYKPQMRERRGVYYTPEPVVSYMVRSVDVLLKEKFNKPLGLADPEVMILDPACGTGTFLLWICQLIYKRFQENPDLLTEGLEDKSWSGYVRERLLPRIFGFELLMAPYAIAHLKLGLFLEETGYQFDSGKRLGVYLTNTLEDATTKADTLFEQFIAEEGEAAAKIKRHKPIMVIVGNPPYSRSSHNRSPWIENLMEAYKANVRNEESQIQGLSNDYIKFIRFAQWKIENTANGIFSFITGHGYINGPQARDMRASLLNTFDNINILNLHGSIRRDVEYNKGERDEPVFNIQQGTAIIVASKLKNSKSEIRYTDIFGSLNTKLRYLEIGNISTTRWNNVKPKKPYFLFTPSQQKSFHIEDEYNIYYSVTDIFGTGNRQKDKEKLWATGFASQQDEFAISFYDSEIHQKISDLINSNDETSLRFKYKLCTTNQWNYLRAKKELSNKSLKINISDCAFRPFDIRRTVFNRNIVTILRSNVMMHLKAKNLALVISRVVNDSCFSHAFVSVNPVDKIFLSSKTSTNAYVFPLHLYPNPNNPKELEESVRPNLSSEFLKDITSKLGYTPTPEAIFYYIYAMLHSPTYRTRYGEFLKRDFPRVPLTSSDELFQQLSEYGEELVALHLMKSPKLDKLITQFVENGGGKEVAIGTAKKAYTNNKVTINKKGDGFTGLPEEVWNFHVGGYQVCHKWLKDRKNRILSQEDIKHYQRIVVSLQETIKLMNKIDQTIPEFPLT